jgi:hypothetical protein
MIRWRLIYVLLWTLQSGYDGDHGAIQMDCGMPLTLC